MKGGWHAPVCCTAVLVALSVVFRRLVQRVRWEGPEGTDAVVTLPPNDTTTGGPALRHTLFVNPKSGSGTGDDRLDAALAALPDAEVVRIEPGVDLGRHVDAAIAADRVVVAAGGDGTVNAVAQHVVGRGVLG